ncbi:glycosyltransferase [Arthrobacter sp. Bi26]|uniref:glycosyltransferase family protein n=1 Tax=Arthrobacter sp. Bi26 TaxID=2822350 RepID=UPI001E42758C|nr:glycosyltransferase [Arthrobacter sp. Bi26]
MRVGTNSRSVAEGYKTAGHDVAWVDISPSTTAAKGSKLWYSVRKLQRVTAEEDTRVLREVNAATLEFGPDILLAIKVIHYDQSIFLDNRIPIKVHQSFDDVSNPDNVSAEYLDHEADWDHIVTTKRHNVPELYARGAKDVLFIWGAYDPQFRRRTTSLDQRPFDIGFIGASRPDRCTLPRQFADNAPFKGIIYGPRWHRRYPIGVRGVALKRAATGPAYTVAANSFKIGLILLNSENRDQHTNRTFEAPASGQLVLAQRTVEHLEVFQDGVSGILFDHMGEAWEHVRNLQRNPVQMRNIAEAGFMMISKGGHTYRDRANQVIKHVSS